MVYRYVAILLVGIFSIVLVFGCVSGPPHQLVANNDHAGLAAWYHQEALDLRSRAKNMLIMAEQYEERTTKPKHGAVAIRHSRELAEQYTKAADKAEALAKFHNEQQ